MMRGHGQDVDRVRDDVPKEWWRGLAASPPVYYSIGPLVGARAGRVNDWGAPEG